MVSLGFVGRAPAGARATLGHVLEAADRCDESKTRRAARTAQGAGALASAVRRVNVGGLGARTATGGCQRMTTLRRARPPADRRPQCAFKVSMIDVSCSSHYISELAPFFIDGGPE